MTLFANDFQGGAAFEVFTPQGSSPLSNWKISGPGSKATKKVYEKAVKGYVFQCPGGHGFKMQFPKDERKSMCLVQKFLCLQVYVAAGQQFSLDLSVTVEDNTRRRLFLSSAFQEVKATALHAQIPMQTLSRDCWTNLVFHCASLVDTCFSGHLFKSLDVLVLGGTFKLRRMFTLKQQPLDSMLQRPAAQTTPIPASMTFPAGVAHHTQVIDEYALYQAPAEAPHRQEGLDGATPVSLSVQGAASPPTKRGGQNIKRQSSRNQGSKIPGPPNKDAPSSSPEARAHGADEGRRAQSAAIQRQAAQIICPPTVEGNGASGRTGSLVRKVSSAASAPGMRMRARASVAPQRVNLDLIVDSGAPSSGPLCQGVSQLNLQPAVEDQSLMRSPKPAEISGGNLPAMHVPHKSGTAKISSTNIQRQPEGTSLHARRKSNQPGGMTALPDVLGVSAEPRIPQWATESVQVSNSSAFFKQHSQNGRYSDSAHGEESAVSPTHDAKRYWSDVSRLTPEDVPLLRQTSHSSSSRGPGSANISPQNASRVARLPRSPVSNAKSGAEQLARLSSSRSVRRTLGAQLDMNTAVQDPFANKQSLGSPSKASPTSQSAAGHLRLPPRMDDQESDKLSIGHSFSLSKPVLTSISRDMPTGDVVLLSGNSKRMELHSRVMESADDWHVQAAVKSDVDSSLVDARDSKAMGSLFGRESRDQAMPRRLNSSADSEIDEEPLREQPAADSPESQSSGSPRMSSQFGPVVGEELPSMESGHEPRHSQHRPTVAASSGPASHRQDEILDLDVMGMISQGPSATEGHEPQLPLAPSEHDTGVGKGWSMSEDAYSAANMMQHQRAFTPPVVPPSRMCNTANRDLQPLDAEAHGSSGPSNLNDAELSLHGIDEDTEYRDLIYDPILNCYYDSKSNQYFAVK